MIVCDFIKDMIDEKFYFLQFKYIGSTSNFRKGVTLSKIYLKKALFPKNFIKENKWVKSF